MWHYTSLLTSETLFPHWANAFRDTYHFWFLKEKYIGKHLTEYKEQNQSKYIFDVQLQLGFMEFSHDLRKY